MRHSFVIVLLTLLSHQGFTQFVDNFSDGDFSSDPAWSGDVNLFTVVDVDGNNMLRSNAGQLGSSGSYYLSTSSTDFNNTTWEFFIDLRFGTSGVNFVEFHLVSDNLDLDANQNGYFVRVGETADRIALYPIVGGTTGSALLASPDKITENESFKIRVTRDAIGNWNLAYDEKADGSFENAGSAFDNNVVASVASGLLIQQSTASGPANAHFFDDFFVGKDTSPPSLSSVEAISQTEIDLTFSENVDETTAEAIANYSIDGGISIVASSHDATNKSLVHLTTSTLTNGDTQTLTVMGVEDNAGNVLVSEQVQFQYLVFSSATSRDVQINEFLSDPGADSNLPNADFVELFNNTDNYFNLEGWQVLDAASSSSLMPEYALAPGEYVVICDEDDAPEFQTYGETIGLSSFPSFNNTDDEIILLDDRDMVIDEVVYGSDIADEGVSNEQVNPELVCSGDFNFKPSISTAGGTPGTENSVLMIVPDNFAPELSKARALSSDSIRVDFNEFIDKTTVDLTDFTISNGISLTEISLQDEYPQSAFFKSGDPLTENETYTVSVMGVSDCSGNVTTSSSVDFVLGITPDDDDILLSEVLFNPNTGSFDFVEIYNPSATEHFELSGWQLARLDADGEIDDPTSFADEGLVIAPGAFLVFSEAIIEYSLPSPDVLVELAIPSYSDDEGSVLLLNPSGEIVQQFDYLDDYHYDLLKDDEGVSLERVSYDNPVNDSNNWRSAASTVGFATPGAINSQSALVTESSGSLTIDPKVFLPGNAGTGRDFTTINYNFQSGGKFANVMIYDQAGRPIKELANGTSLSTSGFFRWDGVSDSGVKARMGYYIVVFETYDGNGNIDVMRETVVVGRDF